ncbi:hypothetical protein [Paracraurococcus lichenis]|uniref:Uncharacterized protein n=1 Tax=Paracraurococcus lichenis TaxID=3064888 RepID=A0ABT9DS62_9PROT|nr:hypothetical protein [Paracraurococcus sp. LOR1-02]MDO9706744.1 hypothetical protein [Paracraurococcus sp. LOR1-02]
MTTPIAEDFAAIRARLEAIRAAECRVGAPPDDEATPPSTPGGPGDFYMWLMGGGLWGSG